MELNKREYFNINFQIEKLTNVLITLDMLEAHGMRFTEEIQVIELYQDRLFRRIEKKEAKKGVNNE